MEECHLDWWNPLWSWELVLGLEEILSSAFMCVLNLCKCVVKILLMYKLYKSSSLQ